MAVFYIRALKKLLKVKTGIAVIQIIELYKSSEQKLFAGFQLVKLCLKFREHLAYYCKKNQNEFHKHPKNKWLDRGFESRSNLDWIVFNLDCRSIAFPIELF